jgi:hypothetical protein
MLITSKLCGNWSILQQDIACKVMHKANAANITGGLIRKLTFVILKIGEEFCMAMLREKIKNNIKQAKMT